MLNFDHPLTERVRSLIRIEHLFNRFNHATSGDDKWSHHIALSTLFEIMESSSRAELKLDILQELERQRQSEKYQNDAPMLERLNQTAQNLQEVQQKFGQHIRENEWLMAVKQRMLVAGGTTPVELPSYYFWQKVDAQKRRQDLQCWSEFMMPTYHAVHLLLEILRSNQIVVQCHAQAGHYEHSKMEQNIHLLTIAIPQSLGALPEVSANKYFTHIRFVQVSQEGMRGEVIPHDIDFKMIVCSFDGDSAIRQAA